VSIEGESCVCVIGAGASYGARDGLRPPLGDELAAYLYRWYRENEQAGRIEVDALAHNAEINDLDSTRPSSRIFDRNRRGRPLYRRIRWWLWRTSRCGNFESQAYRLLRAEKSNELRRMIWKTLAFSMLMGLGCSFTEREDLYDQLVERLLRRFQKVAFVSFNYDVLLEEAITRVSGKPPRYPGLRLLEGSPEPGHGISVMKPHGSINWFSVSNIESGSRIRHDSPPTRIESVGHNLYAGDTGRDYAKHGRVHVILELKSPHTFFPPITAVYCPGKPPVHNPGCIEKGRAVALSALVDATNVYVVGLRPQSNEATRFPSRVRGENEQDDPFLVSMLRVLHPLGGRVTIANPSSKDLMGFKMWCPNAALVDTDLAGLIQLLQA